ncbi:MAG: transcriptional regulator, family [Enterovirga sp.]|jgi:transcriptional regulator with XRE-family HTH domain|nr:transcriptional regulator, family [Enterovirga sp.]
MKGRDLVAWNLRRLRVARELSQDALALEAGVDRTYVGRLERRLENPTIAVLERLASALEVPLVELFIEPLEGSRPPEPLRAGRKVK